MAEDTVQLTDLEVIQQFSLAVRGATASRREVIAALEADLAYLGGSRRAAGPRPATTVTRAATPVPARRPAAAAKATPAKKAPAKGARRG